MLKKQFKSYTKGLLVIDVNKKGMGVAKSPEGIVYFIKNTIPGDIVDVNPYKKRKGYIEAEPIKWVTKSSKRVNPRCDYFGVCGGCKWQNMKYEEQLVYKEKSVINDLKQIGKVEIQKELPILGAIDSYFYRNKMEYSFSNNRWLTKNEIEKKGSINKNALGFHKPGRWDKALEMAYSNLESERSHILNLKNYFKNSLLNIFPDVVFNGLSASTKFSTYTLLNVALPIDNEKASLLDFHLDLKGIACSKGSACQSGSTSGSHVLNSIQSKELRQRPSLRFSFSIFNSINEVDYVITSLKEFTN